MWAFPRLASSAGSGFHSNLFCPARLPARPTKTFHQIPISLPPLLVKPTTLTSPPAAKKDFRSIPNAPTAHPQLNALTFINPVRL
ncbi:MAG: hypothetical protein LBQ31_00185 [Bacteroidales bacterium]|jgi:hypothetical protein|nr:hypothetical protein [Bacteroidales bacterium]